MVREYKPVTLFGDGYGFGYMQAGTGRARWHRMTIRERIGLWRRRRHTDDLAGIRGW